MSSSSSLGVMLGIDVGEKRIGVARIHPVARIGEPLAPIDGTSDTVFEQITKLISEHEADGVVVGLPRGLDGQETAQTAYCRKFASSLKSHTSCPVYLIDEAGSSKEADVRLGTRSDVSRDSMAAAVFLEDFVAITNQDTLKI